MTDLERHEESERLIDEALREIEAIKAALVATRGTTDTAPKVVAPVQPRVAVRTARAN